MQFNANWGDHNFWQKFLTTTKFNFIGLLDDLRFKYQVCALDHPKARM